MRFWGFCFCWKKLTQLSLGKALNHCRILKEWFVWTTKDSSIHSPFQNKISVWLDHILVRRVCLLLMFPKSCGWREEGGLCHSCTYLVCKYPELYYPETVGLMPSLCHSNSPCFSSYFSNPASSFSFMCITIVTLILVNIFISITHLS